MGEIHFISSFKKTLKIHFLSESRSVKFYKTKLNFKSIDDNFKIPAFLFFNRFVKNAQINDFLHLLRIIKKQVS
jgi:hypothetical protein